MLNLLKHRNTIEEVNLLPITGLYIEAARIRHGKFRDGVK